VRIVGESAVAAGVRRLEALTADGARAYLARQDERVREVAGVLRVKPENLVERVRGLLDERKQLERQLTEARKTIALSDAAPAANGAAASAVRDVGDVKLLARTVHGIAPKDLRGLVDDGKRQVGSGIVAIIGVSEEGKAGLVVGVTDDLIDAHNAVELVKVGAEVLGGKGGGGRPDMAQAGGPDAKRAEEALAAIADRLAKATKG
jgi:alanyl-tRNA synthetase